MISNIRITSLSEAAHVPYRLPLDQNVWISITDAEDKVKVNKLHERFKRLGVSHFSQFFRDWSDEDPEPFIVKNLEVEGPRLQHINNIISFLEPFVAAGKDYKLGINCMAGVSRSTATGIIALVMGGARPMEALTKILTIRPVAWPNLRMLRLAGDRLGVDMYTPIKEWKDDIRKLGIVNFGEKTE
jgi:predicted protein tyrosine phosphatase